MLLVVLYFFVRSASIFLDGNTRRQRKVRFRDGGKNSCREVQVGSEKKEDEDVK